MSSASANSKKASANCQPNAYSTITIASYRQEMPTNSDEAKGLFLLTAY